MGRVGLFEFFTGVLEAAGETHLAPLAARRSAKQAVEVKREMSKDSRGECADA